MTVATVWCELEANAYTQSRGFVIRRIKPEAPCDIRLAVEQPSNTRVLLLRVAATSLKDLVAFPESIGFEVRRTLLPGDGHAHATLMVRLSRPQYADIFTALVEDVANYVALATNDTQAVRALLGRLERWQAFLRRHTAGCLSEEAQRGLYGELWLLGERLIPRKGLQQSVHAWTGPLSTHQDFQFARTAIEVKTSASKQHQKLQVSSERQLDGTGVENLLIFHQSLDTRQSGGETLVERVCHLRSLVAADPLAMQEFEERLFAAGYLDCHAANYEGIGYSSREINYYRVIGNFPRIIETDLRDGVGDVRYTISVTECKHYSISEAEFLDLIVEVHDGQ